MPKRKWRDLSPLARRLLLTGATFEGALKIAALADLLRRPAAQVRGPKVAWAPAIVLVNAAGTVPLAYFRWGRRVTSPGA